MPRTRIILALLLLLSAAVAAAPLRRAVVSLKWDNGVPQESTVVNLTTGSSYDVGTLGAATVGNLVAGDVNVFVVTNTAGSSNPVTNLNVLDTNTLSISVYAFKLSWPGQAGTVQSSTNLSLWFDLAPIGSNSFLIVTNNTTQNFFRVKLN